MVSWWSSSWFLLEKYNSLAAWKNGWGRLFRSAFQCIVDLEYGGKYGFFAVIFNHEFSIIPFFILWPLRLHALFYLRTRNSIAFAHASYSQLVGRRDEYQGVEVFMGARFDEDGRFVYDERGIGILLCETGKRLAYGGVNDCIEPVSFFFVGKDFLGQEFPVGTFLNVCSLAKNFNDAFTNVFIMVEKAFALIVGIEHRNTENGKNPGDHRFARTDSPGEPNDYGLIFWQAPVRWRRRVKSPISPNAIFRFPYR